MTLKTTPKQVLIVEEEVTHIGCNKCGREFDVTDYGEVGNITTIQKSYGYGPKDMLVYISHVCMSCMDEVYDTFAIPPDITETDM